MQIQFILVQTSHSGNIGASARAIKVMGFENLILAAPKCSHLDSQAIAMASGAADILYKAKIFSSLEQAIANSSINIAFTARQREHYPNILDIKHINQFLHNNHSNICSLVFGNEQSGLTNQQVLLCNYISHIKANPNYSSLNLSQAVQIIAYELSYLNDFTNNYMHQIQSASSSQVKAMHNHVLLALEKINFYNPHKNTKLSQKLQKLWARANLNVEEINILRGVCKNIIKKL